MPSRSFPALAVGALAVLAGPAFVSASASSSSPHANFQKRSSGVTADANTVAAQTYDYIVVGAGLAGVTVAARLAENASVSVLVIEAGGDNRTNSQVYDIYEYSQAFNGPMDWAWPSDAGKVIHG